MEALLDALAASAPGQWMRGARWGYAAVSGAHVLGIALLTGAILPLNLRLIGAWRSVPLAALARVLVPAAVAGLVLAMASGSLLFLARPERYALLSIFVVKMALVAFGALHALALHLGPGLGGASPARLRAAGLVSIAVWLSVLALGRTIAFLD